MSSPPRRHRLLLPSHSPPKIHTPQPQQQKLRMASKGGGGGGRSVAAGKTQAVEMEIVEQKKEPVVVQRSRVLAETKDSEEKINLGGDHEDHKSMLVTPGRSCKKRALVSGLVDDNSRDLLKSNSSGLSGGTIAGKKPFLRPCNDDRLLKKVDTGDFMHFTVAETSREGLNLHSTLVSQAPPDSNTLRGSCPGQESKNKKKMPAKCFFFAQGWCKNGNSCRFLHKKEGSGTDNLLSKDEEAVLLAPADFECYTGTPKGSQLPKLSKSKEPQFMLNYEGSLKNQSQRELVRAYGTENLQSDVANGNSFNASKSFYGSCSLTRFTNQGSDCSVHSSGCLAGSSHHRSRSTMEAPNHPSFVSSELPSPIEDKAWVLSVPFKAVSLLSSHKSESLPRSQSDTPVDNIDPPQLGSHKSQMAIPDSTSSKHRNVNAIIGGSSVGCITDKSINKLEQNKSGKRSNDFASLMASDGGCNSGLDGGNQVTHMKTAERKNNAVHKKKQGDKGPSGNEETMRVFHFRLVEFVKELVKPFWKEGCLTRDAHKTVVKKSVEKVLASFGTHQVPATEESMNNYMAVSKSKIQDLVEAYVQKYWTV